ncbi:MAG: hypothetical protein AB7E13_00430 [Arcobacteraceae bacterium]
MANDEENKQPVEPLESESNSAEIKTDEQSDSKQNGTEVAVKEDVPQNDNLDNLLDESENLTQKKAKKLNKVLIIVIGVLIGLLLIGVILFFSGVFDSEEVVTQPSSTEQQNPTQATDGTTTTNQPVEVSIPTYEFKTTDINIPRLNKKLQALIDAPIQQDDKAEDTIQTAQESTDKPLENSFYDEELEALLPKDEQNVPLVKEPDIIATTEPTQDKLNDIETQTTKEQPVTKQEELQDNKQVKEENLVVTKQNEVPITSDGVVTVENKSQDIVAKNDTKNNHTVKDEKNGKHFLKFIQVATLKYKLYTQFLREIKAVDARISICQNDSGRIQIFIGPFLDDKQRSFVIEQINQSVVNDAFGLEFTQEEYFRRCGIKDPS